MIQLLERPIINPNTDNGSYPQYELRAKKLKVSDDQIEIWQLPSTASPHLKLAKRIAGLHGRNLALIEHRLMKQLKRISIDITDLKPEATHFALDEQTALQLGLMFRVLAPMRNRDRMKECVEGIEAMGKEEAAYWLGMAMHRKNPRRVLTALRYLLTER